MTKIHSWFMGSLKSLGQCFHSSVAHTDCLLCSGSSSPLLLLFWAASHWTGIFKMLMSTAATRLHFTSIFSRTFFREPTQFQTSSALYDLWVPTKLVPPSWSLHYQVQLPVNGLSLVTSGTLGVLTLRKPFSGFPSLVLSLQSLLTSYLQLRGINCRKLLLSSTSLLLLQLILQP